MEGPGTSRTPAKRLEPFALASLLTAIVLGWCPLTALAAIVLACVALHRLRTRPGERTGRGLAIGALVISTVILLGEGWLLGELQAEVQDAMTAQATAAVEGCLTPVPEVVPEWDAHGTAPTDAERMAFARAVVRQAGAVTQVSITRRSAEGLTDPTVSTAFIATCERGTVFGNATFATVPGMLPPQLQLRSIEVDVAGTRLRLPAATTPTAPSTPTTP
jgi:hypothetical protein